MRLNSLGLLRLQVGDAVKVNGETVLVDHVNESGARVVPLDRKAVTLKTRFGDEAKFDVPGKAIHIARHVEPDILVERRGAQWLKDFLAARAAGRKVDVKAADTQSTINESETGTMAKKSNKEKNGAAETHSKGKLGELFGFSVTSVIRRLGMAGASVAHVREIMKAQKIEVAPATVQIQTNDGKNGKGTPADLTKAQVDELLKSAEEPTKEAKSDKKTKASGKGGRKPRAGKSATEEVYGVGSVATQTA